MTIQSLPPFTHRPLQGGADALRLRQFLIDTYTLMGREFNWEIRRWEGAYWCVSDAERSDPAWGAHTQIWENAAGEIVGAAIPDGPGDLGLQIHPDWRSQEDAILDWAEAHLATVTDDGRRELVAWAFDWDADRQARLQRRGYVPRAEWFWHDRRRPVSFPVPALQTAEGYTIRSVQDTDADVERWVACSNLVFGQAYRPEYHRNFQRYAPSHNYDLHLVAEAPDGTFAAFAGLTVEATNRYAIFEPVGTHPDHRRKGLARAVMCEGLRRLQALGTADTVLVANWGTADAAHLYASVGLEHDATTAAWVKTF
jgi:ribosomal protein S18 acetylase RimI-like enzyme